MDSFYTLYLLNYGTHKGYTNRLVHLELVLLESGRKFLQYFVADSCLTQMHFTHDLPKSLCDAKHERLTEKSINTSR